MKEVIIVDRNNLSLLRVLKSKNDEFVFTFAGGFTEYLDHNQAHLLMLYLQEHLGYNKVPTIPNEMWLCTCGKWHMKDFICERLGK
jgi:hypothetical protein